MTTNRKHIKLLTTTNNKTPPLTADNPIATIYFLKMNEIKIIKIKNNFFNRLSTKKTTRKTTILHLLLFDRHMQTLQCYAISID
jgi:hypothetical protein